MKKLFFILIALFLMSNISFAQDVPDSSQASSNRQFRRGIPVIGLTTSNLYRMLNTDSRGALRGANFDSLTVDVVSTVSTDTILVDDDFRNGLIVKPTVDVKFRTNRMPSSQWVYVESGEWISFPMYLTSGDTIFVSSVTSIPQVQFIRGRIK